MKWIGWNVMHVARGSQKIIETTIKLLSTSFAERRTQGLQENRWSFRIIWTCRNFLINVERCSWKKKKKKRKSLQRSLSRIRVSRRGWIIMRLMARWFKAGNAFKLSDGRAEEKGVSERMEGLTPCNEVGPRDSRGGWLLKKWQILFLRLPRIIKIL